MKEKFQLLLRNGALDEYLKKKISHILLKNEKPQCDDRWQHWLHLIRASHMETCMSSIEYTVARATPCITAIWLTKKMRLQCIYAICARAQCVYIAFIQMHTRFRCIIFICITEKPCNSTSCVFFDDSYHNILSIIIINGKKI